MPAWCSKYADGSCHTPSGSMSDTEGHTKIAITHQQTDSHTHKHKLVSQPPQFLLTYRPNSGKENEEGEKKSRKAGCLQAKISIAQYDFLNMKSVHPY